MNIDPTDRAPMAPATNAPALQRPTPLTDAQKSQVACILATVGPARLCPDTAQRIHAAFRAAGIHGGFGMREAIEAAGFDSFDLRACAAAAAQAGQATASDGAGSAVDILL